MTSSESSPEKGVFREEIRRFVDAEWLIVVLIFLVHIGLTSIFRTIGLVAMWVWIFILMRLEGRKRIGIRQPNHWGWWVAGPLLGLALIGITAAFSSLTWGWGEENMLYEMGQGIQEWLGGNLPVWLLFTLLGFGWLVESPFMEEPLFRGLIFGVLRGKWSNGVSIFIQALAFTLVHPLHSASWAISIFAAGVVYGLITKYSESIFPAALAHSAYNFGVLWIVLQHFS